MDNRELFDEVAGTYKREVISFNSTKEVCDLFDVQVITDVEETTSHASPCPKIDGDGEECICPPVPLYVIGGRGEANAGLRRFTMSPYFYSTDELEAWCQRNMAKLKEAATKEDMPDATDWA